MRLSRTRYLNPFLPREIQTSLRSLDPDPDPDHDLDHDLDYDLDHDTEISVAYALLSTLYQYLDLDRTQPAGVIGKHVE